MADFRLVITRRDKAIVWAQGALLELIPIAGTWDLLFREPTHNHAYTVFFATICILGLLIPVPLTLLNALTRTLRVTDEGVSIVSRLIPRAQRKRGKLRWEEVERIRMQRAIADASRLDKISVYGCYRVEGLFGYASKKRIITIPGHLPEIEEIVALLRKYSPDTFSE